jgi:hypothetical protein
VGRAPSRGRRWSSGGRGALVDCMWDIFILNVIWVEGKIYILVGILLVEILYSPLRTGTASEQ